MNESELVLAAKGMDLDPQQTITPETKVAVDTATTADHQARRKMDHSLATSLAWRAIADWTSQILTWASLFIVVRLLTPADFGLVGMAVVLVPYLKFLTEFGIPRTVVTLRDLTDESTRPVEFGNHAAEPGLFRGGMHSG